jgi:hypothetical protein
VRYVTENDKLLIKITIHRGYNENVSYFTEESKFRNRNEQENIFTSLYAMSLLPFCGQYLP